MTNDILYWHLYHEIYQDLPVMFRAQNSSLLTVKCPCRGLLAFRRLRRSTIVSFTLHYRTCYHAMHFSAKRGIAIACRLSVRL